jgi:DNA repair exonuclease SbcCD ATPase subunit
VEATLGIKERHAYNYTKLLDLAPDYLKANAGLGVTKLALIASASDEVRAELTSDENTATLSVRELEKKIKEQEAELDRRAEQISFLQSAQSSEQEKKLSDVESAKAELEKEFKKKKEELLQAQSDVLNLTNAKKSLELQLEATKATKVKVKEVVDKTAQEEAERQRARADELEAKLTETTKALENAKSEKKQIASNTIIEFKYKFDDIQRIFGDMIKLIDSMDEASARRCSRAIKAVIEMWLKQRCLAGESGNE